MKCTDHTRGLTQEYLRSILSYDRDSGVFVWLKNQGKAHRGDVAGKPHPHGYILIGIRGYHYLAHRLAWFYVYDEWPTEELDHKNLVKSDNWIDNLRKATKAQNMWNTDVSRRNTSGYKGVRLDPRDGWYYVRIVASGKSHSFGRYSTAEEAFEAHKIAAKKLAGEFARTA